MPMEFPAKGTVRGSGMWSLRNSSVWRRPPRGSGSRRHGVEKPRPGVHGRDEVVHFGQLLGRGMDHQVGAFGHDGQIVVGDQAGDLDDDVAGRDRVRSSRDPSRPAWAGMLPVPGPERGRCLVLSGDAPRAAPPARPGPGGAGLCPARAMPERTCGSRGRLLPARGGRALVPTGVAVAIPQGYAGLVLPRSGLALRHGVTCLNTPGLIDAGYRGELR